jgi:hypothetical protein
VPEQQPPAGFEASGWSDPTAIPYQPPAPPARPSDPWAPAVPQQPVYDQPFAPPASGQPSTPPYPGPPYPGPPDQAPQYPAPPHQHSGVGAQPPGHPPTAWGAPSPPPACGWPTAPPRRRRTGLVIAGVSSGKGFEKSALDSYDNRSATLIASAGNIAVLMFVFTPHDFDRSAETSVMAEQIAALRA